MRLPVSGWRFQAPTTWRSRESSMSPRGGSAKRRWLRFATAQGNTGIPMFEAARSLLRRNAFTARTAIGLSEFVSNVDGWADALNRDEVDHVELAGRIIDESGLVQMWVNTRTPEAEGRVENLKELVKSLNEFGSLQGFLEHVALVFENLEDPGGEKVSLMTLHAAKGLEFPVVFLPGWEEGIFPSKRSMDEMPLQGLEEERRLAYVGITRAMEICTVTCAASRNSYGEWGAQSPSRFIDELPESETETLSPPGLMGGFSRRGGGGSEFDLIQGSLAGRKASGVYSAPGYRRMVKRTRESVEAGPTAPDRIPPSSAPAEFSVGDRVFHRKFGYGTVRNRDGERLSVEFECSGVKNIISRFVAAADGTES